MNRKIKGEHGIICRLPGERFGYFGWPTVARMDDGTLVVASSGLRADHVCPFGKTVLNVSTDDGRTWSAPRAIQNSLIDDRDAGVVSLGGAKLLVSWFRSDTRQYADASWIPEAERKTWAKVFATWSDEQVNALLGSWVMLSDDAGVTWSEPVRAPVSAPHGPIRLNSGGASGDLLYLGKCYGTWQDMGEGAITAARSADGGRTWDVVGAVPVYPGSDPANYHEPHVVELPSGRLVGMIRIQDADKGKTADIGIPSFSIMQTESDDGGQTWTTAHPLGFHGSPPHLLRHSSGVLILTYGYRQAPFGQHVALSRDDGATWEQDWIIRDDGPDGDLGYPSTVEMSDGSLFTVCYQKAAASEKCSLLWSRWRLPKWTGSTWAIEDTDTFFFIPHTHWEGAVFKTREQYLEMGLPIILRALRLLKKHSHYRFVLDQACYVQPFLERYPEEAATFRACVDEGRLAIVGGLDVMPDVNMPGGESFVRQVLYGKGYFRRELGVDITVGWQLDSFGHHAQLPQLMRLAGYQSFWSQRGVPHGDLPSEFLWEGLDGTRIPFYWLPGSYAITYGSPKAMPEFGTFMRQKYDSLARHSLGAGRAGPAGADVCLPEEHVPELVEQFNQQPDPPFRIRIGLPADYEAMVEARPVERPVVKGDLNPIFQGTYSSRIELKQWTRELERLLTTAEKLGALLILMGEAVDNQSLWQAWEPLLFNQAHDLMSGVMTDQVWEDTRRGYEFSRRLATKELDARLRRLAARIDTRGEGMALVVFNALGWSRTDVVLANAGFTEMEADDLELLGPDGQAIPVQLLETERADNGALLRAKVAFVAKNVPALGFAVYRLVPRQAETAAPRPQADNVIENEFCRVEINLADGSIISLVDKRGGWDALGGPGNIVTLEEDRGDLWEPYRPLNGAQFITMKERHPAPPALTALAGAAGVIIHGPVFSEFVGAAGKLNTRIRLYAGLPRIEIHTRLLNSDAHVRYRVLFPTSIHSDRYIGDGYIEGYGFHEIPFGAIPHLEGVECPAQNWIDHGDGNRGLALLNRGLPGNNIADGVLILSLLRSATIGGYGYGGGFEPGMGSDTGLELGKQFAFDYALLPHPGAWNEAGIPREGMAFNHPLIAITAACQPGALPKRWGLLEISSPDVLVSAMKPGENGGVVLRMYEAAGRLTEGVKVRFSAHVISAEQVNLMEDPGRELALDNGSVQLDFRPFEIKTIKLRLKRSETLRGAD